MRAAIAGVCLVLLTSTGSSAQGLAKGVFPDGFRVQTDAPGAAADVVFVTMWPGWHVTTGSAAVLYDGAVRAEGTYRVDAETFLFDPADRNAGYGVFIGGADLEGDEPVYTAFLIRTSGDFMIAVRSGATTTPVVDWTPHASVLRYADRGQAGTAKNVLAVDVQSDVVRFSVNGTEVSALPRARVGAEGAVGLRVGENVNLHLSSLVVTKH